MRLGKGPESRSIAKCVWSADIQMMVTSLDPFDDITRLWDPVWIGRMQAQTVYKQTKESKTGFLMIHNWPQKFLAQNCETPFKRIYEKNNYPYWRSIKGKFWVPLGGYPSSCSPNITPYCLIQPLYNSYIGGICWYISRVLSQGTQLFPFNLSPFITFPYLSPFFFLSVPKGRCCGTTNEGFGIV